LYLQVMGRLDEAIAELQQSRDLNPTAAVVSEDLAWAHIYAHQYDRAVAQSQRVLELDRDYFFAFASMGLAYAQQGGYQEAIDTFGKMPTSGKDNPESLGLRGYIYARWGKHEEARQGIAELQDLATRRFAHGHEMAIARIYAGLEDKDRAFQWLHKAYEAGWPWLVVLKVDPTFDNLHSDLRFDEILQDIGLAAMPTPIRRASEGSPAPIDTLAVLPFDNQSTDAEAGYLGDDITYSLTDSLARVRELKVRPYSSAARFKAGSTDSKTAGRELQVQAVLRGSVQKRGDEIVIDVELVHVGDDRRIWGDRYPGKLAERLALQQRIIQEVPEKLRLTLSGQEKQALAKLPTPSLKAHELYVQGRFEWNKRTAPGLEKSIDLYRQAIDQDPEFALAWAGLAEAYFTFPITNDTPPKDSILKANAAATKALEIDVRLAEAHTVLASIAGAYEWDWSEADRKFQQAVALSPNDATAHYRYSQHLMTMGRFDEAQVHSQRARELDPLSLIIRAVTGRHFYYARQYEAAIAQYRKALEIDPNFWVARLFLGHAYAQQGKHEEAIAEFQRVRQLPGANLESLASLGQLYAVMGRAAEARQVLDEFNELSKQRYIPRYYFAMIYAALGEKERAFAELDKAYDDRNFFIALLRVEPMFDSLRDEPRFQKIVADMKFPE
jgi:tetratricopeptide (TPR) repeat protein